LSPSPCHNWRGVTIPEDEPATQTNIAALALVASSVGDPEGTRTITSIVVLLAVLGIALVMIAFWLFRLTRPDKELLAPLEGDLQPVQIAFHAPGAAEKPKSKTH